MRYALVFVLSILSVGATSQISSNNKTDTNKGKESKQKYSDPKLDASSLEKAIRDSIKEASERHDPNADEKLKADRELVEYTRKLAAETERLSDFTCWLVIVTVGLGTIAFFQLLMFGSQLRLMKKGAKDTTDLAEAAKMQAQALQIGERAWVSYIRTDHIEFQNATFIDTGETIKSGVVFTIIWTNAGRTPAIKCNLFSDSRVVEHGAAIPTFISPTEETQRRGTMVPGVTAFSVRRTISQTDIDALEKRQRKVFIYGRADYEDIFANKLPRHTEVCLEIEVNGFLTRKDGKKVMNFEFLTIGPQNTAS
jgi:hypothetical protein